MERIIDLVFVHNNLGIRPEYFLKWLFSVEIPQCTTQGLIHTNLKFFMKFFVKFFVKFSVKTFNYSKSMRCVIVKKNIKHILPCSSERAETRVFRLNVSIFFWRFMGENFSDFFVSKGKKIFMYLYTFLFFSFFANFCDTIFFTVVCRYLVGSVSIPGPPWSVVP